MNETRTRMEQHLHTGLHEITHWLYDPALMGRKTAHVRFSRLHRIHLIPARWMTRACDRYDRRAGLSDADIARRQPTGRRRPPVIAALAGRLAVALTRYAHHRGLHRYLSTGCLHGRHAYCAGKAGQAGVKIPARCKWCTSDAPTGHCVCSCHQPTTTEV